MAKLQLDLIYISWTFSLKCCGSAIFKKLEQTDRKIWMWSGETWKTKRFKFPFCFMAWVKLMFWVRLHIRFCCVRFLCASLLWHVCAITFECIISRECALKTFARHQKFSGGIRDIWMFTIFPYTSSHRMQRNESRSSPTTVSPALSFADIFMPLTFNSHYVYSKFMLYDIQRWKAIECKMKWEKNAENSSVSKLSPIR